MSGPLIRGIIIFICLVGLVPMAHGWVHPGTLNTRAQYDLMKQKVAAPANPWKESFDSIAVTNGILSYNDQAVASLSVTAANGQAPWDNSIGEDAIVMQAAAIKWAAGGSISYANKARQLLMAWVNTLNHIEGDEKDHRVAWTTPKLIHTAEILRDLPGSPWTGSDETAFRNWVATELLTRLPTTSASSPAGQTNRVTYRAVTRLMWGVYTENQTIYNQGLKDLMGDADNLFKGVIRHTISRFGHSGVFAGYTIQTCREREGWVPNGNFEGSDLTHVAGYLEATLAAAEIVKNQGNLGGDVYAYVGSDEGWGLRHALEGHEPFYGWSTRAGTSTATWPCDLLPYAEPFNRYFSRMSAWNTAYNHYRNPKFLAVSTFYGHPEFDDYDRRPTYFPYARLTHNYFGLVDEGPTPPPPTPTTPQVLYASTTGTGTACTLAAPCSATEVVNKHNGGDTINLLSGTYAVECDGCLKSGTAGQPTVLRAVAQAGSTIAVGTDGVLVNPGLATLSGNTGITLWIKPGQEHITVDGVNCTTTGSGTNPCLQISDQTATSANAAKDIILRNMDITAPTRIGATAAAMQRGTNGTERVTWDRVRIHHAGAAVNFDQNNPTTHGLRLNGPDHRIINSDIYSNQASGISARCEGCTTTRVDRLTITGSRFYDNGYHGIDLGEGTDQLIAHNIFTGNGGAGLHVFGTTRRADIFQNSISSNSQLTSIDAYGIYLASPMTAVVRNNIITDHPLGPIFVGSLASQVGCSNNLTDAASGSALCSSWTFNGVPANIWEDHDHTTLASRDFRLKAGSAAIDNGTTGICTPANVQANLCTPALSVAGANGTAPDQGAIESGFTAPPPPPGSGQLIASYNFDADFTDSTTFSNDGTATSVTIDTSNKVAGAGAALFNASTDRITIPLNGASISQGMSLAISARPVVMGTFSYLFGHSSLPGSFADRFQIKKEANDTIFLGIGGASIALQSQYTMVQNEWVRVLMRLTPGTVAGTGTVDLWIEGIHRGTATYTGLTQITSATIGNSDTTQGNGWNGQLDELRIWNYPVTGNEVSTDCDSFCGTPTPPDDEFLLGSGQIGPSGNNVVEVQIISGADPSLCTPLSDYQVIYDESPQVETGCSMTGTTNPILRITTETPAVANQVVTLTYQDRDPIIIQNQIQGGGSFDPLVLTSCATDVTGLSYICQAQGNPNPHECFTLTNFIARDECVPVVLDSCGMSTGPGPRVLTLRRISPPVNGTIALDLIYVPSDQRIGVTNLFDPTDPEIPPTTDLAQTQWRCRPDGLDSSTPWRGRPNQLCEVPSPGGINIRLAIANTSGAPILDFGTSLFCSRQNEGEEYGNFQRVGPDFGTLGIRFGVPTPHGVPDGGLLPSAALPVGGGLTYAPIGGFRRRELQSGRPTLENNHQLEEEYALETGPTATALPVGTRFVCRAHDRLGNRLTSYTGLAGCSNDVEPFTGGEVPCGAPLLVTAPQRRGR